MGNIFRGIASLNGAGMFRCFPCFPYQGYIAVPCIEEVFPLVALGCICCYSDLFWLDFEWFQPLCKSGGVQWLTAQVTPRRFLDLPQLCCQVSAEQSIYLFVFEYCLDVFQ